MRRTYITQMPDKAGAFLLASRIIAAAGGNIVRVNYNKAVDLHTLFLEVSADAAQHETIERQLAACGYLAEPKTDQQILMIVVKLEDVPGAVVPVLEILRRYRVNISYISSQENGTPYQHFKMGLLIENTAEIKGLIEEISRICEIHIPDYEVTDRLLDGTVFYVSFANTMRDILDLNQEQTNAVLICANRLMQILDEQKKSPLQTFDYIRRFAKFVRDRRGERFRAQFYSRQLAQDLYLHVIDPPCGSNTYVLECGEELLFVDSGFACYRSEMLALLEAHFPGFSHRPKQAWITHADVDHAGLLSLFDEVYMSRNCYENFAAEQRGEPNFREQNPLHEPYCALSKVISGYAPPDLARCKVVGEKRDQATLTPIGERTFGRWRFTFLEGNGGHVRGETVIVCQELQLLFSGDIYVNIKGFSKEQQEFNALAPFLMTGVDSDPAEARRCRERLCQTYAGYLFCPGHGTVCVHA
ncbi:MAG: MBL fold metallo-hydrolase [Candidatus Spyradocola sp.]